MNQAKTFFLMVMLTVILVGLGSVIGGQNGAVLAFAVALAMNFVSYWFSDRIVLSMYRAREVTESQAPDLWNIVASLSQRASIPMPRVYIIENDSPNAFATGRNPEHSAVAVTTGILRILDKQELEGVLCPRALPRKAPGHPHIDRGRDPRRGHHHARQLGQVVALLRRKGRRRRAAAIS